MKSVWPTGCSCLLLITCWVPLCRATASTTRHHKYQVHRSLKKRDLGRIFGVDVHEDVPAYDITYPKVYTDGENLGSLGRRRRTLQSITGDASHYTLGLSAHDKHYLFNVSLNRHFLSPNFHIEKFEKNGTVTTKRYLDHNCHYAGHLLGQRNSSVALTLHDGMRGYFKETNKNYFIEPLPAYVTSRLHSDEDEESRPHVVFEGTFQGKHRRSLPSLEAFWDTMEKQKTPKSCGTKNNPKIRLLREADDEAEVGGNQDQRERYIETLVVVDQKMCNYHGEDAATQFTMAVLNMVASLLRDGSIGNALINLVVVKMQLLTIDPPGLVVNHHAQNTLSSFGVWAGAQSDPDDNSDDHYDYAILLTRYNICADKNQPCDTLGQTNTGGMCRWPYSASVNEDNGLPLAFTITHGIGHSLGMNHDGPGGPLACPDGVYMMGSTISGKETGYVWSRCSRNYLRQFLSKKESHCLLDLPSKSKRIDFEKLDNKAGVLYDADKQCEMQIGTGSKFCKDRVAEICYRLWCTQPDREDKCTPTNMPAADGTDCGTNKWCIRGKCIPYSRSIALDGGWSSWSQEYTPCSRTCGGGVQYRERLCNKPKPRFGGKHCEGEPRSYRLCNVKPCAEGGRNFRSVQCERLNARLFGEKYFDWEFKPSRIPQCKLGCFIHETLHGYDFGNVDDGTNCDQLDDSVLADKCINGDCVPVGCDGIINSNAKFDRCGICNGDGRTCSTGEGRSEIPDNDGISEALRSLKDLGFDMGTLYGKAELSLTNRGLIPHGPKDGETSEFVWARVKSGCSVSCGGGFETVKGECRRQDDGSPAPDSRCPANVKPPSQTFPCKTELCAPTWLTSYWGDCSKTCNGGVKKRDVRCVQKSGDNVEYEVDDSLCAGSKPPDQELCNREPCPPEWIAQPFGECSTICGPGVQVREVLCQKVLLDGSLVTVKESECSKDVKPPTEQKCNVHNPCPGDAGCGGIYTDEQGNFSSPNFPKNYPDNIECVHIIQVPENKVIQLYFDSLRIVSPEDGNCKSDFVKVMDGDCVSRLGESKFCGKEAPPVFTSTTNRLCVKFFSDDSQNDRGFSATYQATDPPSQPPDLCGGNISAPAGLLASPNYPEYYPSNEDCNISISVVDAPVKLTFHAFDVGSDDCSNDFVFLSGGDETKKYCGQKVPPAYTSKGNHMFVRFVSSNHPGNTKPGFVATYTSGNGQGGVTQGTDESESSNLTPALDSMTAEAAKRSDFNSTKQKSPTVTAIPQADKVEGQNVTQTGDIQSEVDEQIPKANAAAVLPSPSTQLAPPSTSVANPSANAASLTASHMDPKLVTALKGILNSETGLGKSVLEPGLTTQAVTPDVHAGRISGVTFVDTHQNNDEISKEVLSSNTKDELKDVKKDIIPKPDTDSSTNRDEIMKAKKNPNLAQKLQVLEDSSPVPANSARKESTPEAGKTKDSKQQGGSDSLSNKTLPAVSPAAPPAVSPAVKTQVPRNRKKTTFWLTGHHKKSGWQRPVGKIVATAWKNNLNGRGNCPSREQLRCIHVLMSFPCKADKDCRSGLTCCATGCEYGLRMCVPRVTRACPLRDPYYQPYIPCGKGDRCAKDLPCCQDMLGRKYCLPTYSQLINTLHQ